jgi:hypothetical protein
MPMLFRPVMINKHQWSAAYNLEMFFENTMNEFRNNDMKMLWFDDNSFLRRPTNYIINHKESVNYVNAQKFLIEDFQKHL